MERLLIDFLRKVVFGSQYDDNLRNVLKGATKAEDLLASEPFKALLDRIHEELAKMVLAGNDEADEEDASEAGRPVLHEVLGEILAEDGSDAAAELMTLAKQAEELVDQFVKLVVEQDSNVAMVAVMQSCPASQTPKRAILIYDSKCAGEATAQPHVRRPQFRRDHFGKVLNAFCQSRGADQLSENDLLLFFDGGRQLAPMMLSCCVRQGGDEHHGRHFDNKTRVELMIHYDESSMRARKCLQRGMLQTHETLHLVSNGAASVQEKTRAVYSGTSLGSSIGPVKLDALDADAEDVWLLSKADKDQVYGAAGKVLSGGGLADCPDRPVFSNDLHLMSYHSMPQALFCEVLHSFDAALLVHLVRYRKVILCVPFSNPLRF